MQNKQFSLVQSGFHIIKAEMQENGMVTMNTLLIGRMQEKKYSMMQRKIDGMFKIIR